MTRRTISSDVKCLYLGVLACMDHKGAHVFIQRCVLLSPGVVLSIAATFRKIHISLGGYTCGLCVVLFWGYKLHTSNRTAIAVYGARTDR